MPRRSTQVALAVVAAVAAACTRAHPAPAAAAVSTPVVREYAYGTASAAQRLDAYYTPGKSGLPWVAVVHGGSWSHLDKADTRGVVDVFRAAGYVVVSLNYRLSGEAPWPAQRLDVANALIWTKAHAAALGINPRRGAVYGFSAGGQLAAEMGTIGPGGQRVRAVVSVAGAVDPWRGWRYTHGQEAAARAAGVTPTAWMRGVAEAAATLVRCPPTPTNPACWARWHEITPQNYATRDDAPTLLYAAADDPAVPWDSSPSLAYHLRRAGVPVTFEKATTGGHSQVFVFGNPTRKAQLLAFLRTHTAA